MHHWLSWLLFWDQTVLPCFVQVSAVNSFWPEGSVKTLFIALSSRHPCCWPRSRCRLCWCNIIHFCCLCWGIHLHYNPNQTLKCFAFRSNFICLNELEWFKFSVSCIKTTVNLKLRANILSFSASVEKPKCPALDLRNEWEEFPYRSCVFWLERQHWSGDSAGVLLSAYSFSRLSWKTGLVRNRKQSMFFWGENLWPIKCGWKVKQERLIPFYRFLFYHFIS